MKKELGKKMQEIYSRKFQEHGYSPSSLGCPKGRQGLRFKALTSYLKFGSLLDFGCGFGDLADYLENENKNVTYSGCDVMDEFLIMAKEQYPHKNFFKVKIGALINSEYDYVCASGVFNFLYSSNKNEHQDLVFKTLENLFSVARKSLSVDFLSPFVDFEVADMHQQKSDQLTEFVNLNLTRKFVIDHSYMPYEYCIHLFKDDDILRPNNVFKT